MLIKRALAVVVAVALVVGAFLLRRNVLDDDEAGPETTTSATDPPPATVGELICITELADVCNALQAPDVRITVRDAGVTLDALAALPDDETRPAWLTIRPYPEMLDELRTANRLEPFAVTADVLGASQLAIATTAQRSTELATACAGAPLWGCVGANAGNEWSTLAAGAAAGRVRPSVGVADRQAVALASFAAAVAGYVGRPDIRSSDWQDDPAFTPWVRRLLGTVDAAALSAGTPLGTMAIRQSLLDVAATTDAELAALGGDRFVANYPQPSMWVEAVLAVPAGTALPESVSAELAAGLAAAGWADPSAATQALPGATTMLALRTLWQESTS